MKVELRLTVQQKSARLPRRTFRRNPFKIFEKFSSEISLHVLLLAAFTLGFLCATLTEVKGKQFIKNDFIENH